VIDAHSRVARRDRVICQEADGKQVLLNLADGQYYALDDVGSRIWALCDGDQAVSEIAHLLSLEYDAPAEVIEMDAVELLEDLLEAELVVQIA
jgi:hypothetical protein